MNIIVYNLYTIVIGKTAQAHVMFKNKYVIMIATELLRDEVIWSTDADIFRLKKDYITYTIAMCKFY